ncbi:hypothetical protein [Halococcus sp. AFM35]|uniref:hypothetical protein n=1 Tax=Halococcus sp. AFM35 TaxID=3421653 RepID=UPI003EBBCB8D
MSNNGDSSGSSRSSISVSESTKARFNTLRRQYAAHANEDMTGDDTLELLLDSFEEEHDWANTEGAP